MSDGKRSANNRVLDKRVARKLIQELQVRAGWQVSRLAAPSRPTRRLPVSTQVIGADPCFSGERVMSPQAVALAKRQLERQRRRQPATTCLGAALEAYPRIVERVCQLWGFREIRPYLQSLLLVEVERVERQGLALQAQEELMFLYALTEDFATLVFAPEEREPARELSELYHFAR